MVSRSRSPIEAPVFLDKMQAYVDKLALLCTTVPSSIREQVLPQYMRLILGGRFRSFIYPDRLDNLAFEIERLTAAEKDIRIKDQVLSVEGQIFGFHDTQNPQNNLLRFKFYMNLKFEDVVFEGNSPMGVIDIEFSSVKLFDCWVRWNKESKEPYIKEIPFAWILHWSLVKYIEPLVEAEKDYNYHLLKAFSNLVLARRQRINDAQMRVEIKTFFTGLLSAVESEFEEKITITEAQEPLFQQLLDKYAFLLYPSAQKVTSHPSIIAGNKRQPDYLIQAEEGNYIFTEIEPPGDQPFSNGKQTARLKGALTQVSDWKQIIPQMEEYKSARVTYMIVIGLSSRMNQSDKDMLNQFNSEQTTIIVKTWDELLSAITTMKEKLNKL